MALEISYESVVQIWEVLLVVELESFIPLLGTYLLSA